MDQIQADILACLKQSDKKYFSTADVVNLTKLPLKKVRVALHNLLEEKLLSKQYDAHRLQYFVTGKVFNTAQKIDRTFRKPLEGYTKRLLLHKELCMLVNRR